MIIIMISCISISVIIIVVAAAVMLLIDTAPPTPPCCCVPGERHLLLGQRGQPDPAGPGPLQRAGVPALLGPPRQHVGSVPLEAGRAGVRVPHEDDGQPGEQHHTQH